VHYSPDHAGGGIQEFAAMHLTRQGLVGHFQLLSDDELVAEFQDGDLTELAKNVAAEELLRRKKVLHRPVETTGVKRTSRKPPRMSA
jgi:hypothetical protein